MLHCPSASRAGPDAGAAGNAGLRFRCHRIGYHDCAGRADLLAGLAGQCSASPWCWAGQAACRCPACRGELPGTASSGTAVERSCCCRSAASMRSPNKRGDRQVLRIGPTDGDRGRRGRERMLADERTAGNRDEALLACQVAQLQQRVVVVSVPVDHDDGGGNPIALESAEPLDRRRGKSTGIDGRTDDREASIHPFRHFRHCCRQGQVMVLCGGIREACRDALQHTSGGPRWREVDQFDCGCVHGLPLREKCRQ